MARETAADRWRAHGAQTIALHTQDLGFPALWWRAVWEVGCLSAALDGASALVAAGVTGYESAVVHVSVPDAFSPARVDGVRVHRVLRVEGEVIERPRRPTGCSGTGRDQGRTLGSLGPAGGPAPRAADPAGDRLRPTLAAASRAIRGRRRRALVPQLVRDITDGARSLGELDFATMCRRRGLPEPDRQSLRRTTRGNAYLDVEWRGAGLVVEVDGSQHTAGLALVVDHLRQNEVTLQRGRVLRISLLGLRVSGDAFLDQVARGLSGPGRSEFQDRLRPGPG